MKRLLLLFSLLLAATFSNAQNLALDPTFTVGTGFNTAAHRILLQPDGKLIIGGYFSNYNGSNVYNITRLNSNGTLDGTFITGVGASYTVEAMTLQSNGKIIIAGNFTSYNNITANRIVRLNSDGSFDPTFVVGLGFNGRVLSLAMQSNGQIIVGGEFSSYQGISSPSIARLNSDGSRDASFVVGSGFGIGARIDGLAIQSNGKILAGGAFSSYQGASANNIIRLNFDGTIDNSFDITSGTNGSIEDIEIQTDGKILIGGIYTYCKNVSRSGIARLNTDGTLDVTFNPGTGIAGGSNLWVEDVAIDASGNILIGGSFSSFNSVARNNFCILNNNGSLNTNFGIGTSCNSLVQTVDIQPDGKILLGGIFSTFNNNPSNTIARLILDNLTITTGTVPLNICRGSIVNVPFTIQGTFSTGNIYTAQLSDASGSFANPVAIGTLAGTNAGTIVSTIPANTVPGTGYRIRVVSSNPVVLGSNNGVNINITASPAPVITGDEFVCRLSSGVYSVIPEPGVSYQWSGSGFNSTSPMNGTSINVQWNSGATSGNVTVVATNIASGCTYTVTKNIAILDPPAPVITGEQNICKNIANTYSTAYNSNYSYNWSASGGFIQGSNSNSTVSVIWTSGSTGTLTLAVTEGTTSCTGSATKTVNLFACEITTGATQTVICRGNTLSVPYNAVGLFNSNNIFHVELSDANGSFTFPVSIGTGTSALSGTIIATIPANTPPGLAYRVRVVSSNPVINGTDNGANIAIYAYPNATISGRSTVCKNSTSTYSVTEEPGVTYLWSVTGGTIVGSNTGSSITVQWAAAASGVITLVATNTAGGCVVTVHKNVNIIEPPNPVINGELVVCLGQSYTYSSNLASDYAYEWSVTGGTISGSNTANPIEVNWGPGTTGTITVKVTDQTSTCFASITKNVTINKSPIPTITGNNPVCEGDTIKYSANVEPGTAYEWVASGGTILGSANDPTVNVIIGAGPTAAVTLTETYTATGCKTKITKNITVNKLPVVEITGNFDVCLNSTEKYEISSNLPVNCSWSVIGGSIIGATTNNTVYVNWTSLPSGKIKLWVTDNATGCKKLIEKDIKINTAPKVFAGKDTTICFASPLTIGNIATGGSGDYTYSWDPAVGLSASDIAMPNVFSRSSTQYIVTVTDSRGCSSKDTIIVSVLPEIKLSYDGGIVLCQDSIGLLGCIATGGTGSLSYQWEPSAGLSNPKASSTILKLTEPGFYQYKITVKDALGCSVEALLGVTVLTNKNLTFKTNDLDFGKLDGCTSYKEMELEVSNGTQVPIAIDNIEFSNPEFSLMNLTMPINIGFGESIAIPIKYSPTKSGISNCDVTFTSVTCNPKKIIKLKGEKLQMLLSAKPTSFNLGKKLLCESSSVDTTITIINSGTDVATFDFSAATCLAPYSIVSPKGIQTIAPGKSLNITIRFNPNVTGVFNYAITLPFTAGTCKDAIKLSFVATVTGPVISTDLSSINFGTMLGCDTYRDSTITISNTGTTDAQIVSLGVGEFTTLTPLPITIKPGEKKTITVRFTPVTQGSGTSSIKLTSQPCGTITEIPVNFIKQGVSYSIPDTVDCGDLVYCAQKTNEAYFSIGNNTTGSECEISAVKVSGDFTSNIAVGSKIISGGTGSYKVTFTPSNSTIQGQVLGYIDVTVKPCDVSKRIILKARKTDVHLSINTSELNFGTMLVGETGVQQVKLTNTGTAIVEVKPEDITTKAPFVINSITPAPSTILKPGDSIVVSVKYTALSGDNTDLLTLNVKKPCPVSFNVALKGKGTVLVGKITATIKDFGEVYVNETKADSIEVANVGELDVQLNSLTSSNSEFAVQPGQFPVKLAKAQSKFIRIDFTPLSVGKKFSNLVLNSDIMNVNTSVTGTGIERPVVVVSAEIGLDDLRKKSGERFMLPLVIRKSQNIDLNKTSGYEAIIKYNKTLMVPYNYGLNSSILKEYQYVTLKGDLKKTLGVIGEFEFVAALGLDSCTTIQIDSIKWIGANIPTVVVPGSLCITDICRTCGDRFVNPDATLAINAVSVDNTGNAINVDFDVNEKAPTMIKLVNILGETVYSQEILPNALKNNIYRINFNGVSSGVYFITISNEERMNTKIISLEK